MELFLLGLTCGFLIGFMTAYPARDVAKLIPDNPEHILPPVTSCPPMPNVKPPKYERPEDRPKPQGPPNRDVRTNKPIPSYRSNRRYF